MRVEIEEETLVQQLKAFAALIEAIGSALCTYMIDHNHLQLHFYRDLPPSFGRGTRHPTYTPITTPDRGFFTREKNLTTAVQEPNKERSGRQVSEETLLLGTRAAHSGADHSGRPYTNQTPPRSLQASPGE